MSDTKTYCIENSEIEKLLGSTPMTILVGASRIHNTGTFSALCVARSEGELKAWRKDCKMSRLGVTQKMLLAQVIEDLNQGGKVSILLAGRDRAKARMKALFCGRALDEMRQEYPSLKWRQFSVKLAADKQGITSRLLALLTAEDAKKEAAEAAPLMLPPAARIQDAESPVDEAPQANAPGEQPILSEDAAGQDSEEGERFAEISGALDAAIIAGQKFSVARIELDRSLGNLREVIEKHAQAAAPGEADEEAAAPTPLDEPASGAAPEAPFHRDTLEEPKPASRYLGVAVAASIALAVASLVVF